MIWYSRLSQTLPFIHHTCWDFRSYVGFSVHVFHYYFRPSAGNRILFEEFCSKTFWRVLIVTKLTKLMRFELEHLSNPDELSSLNPLYPIEYFDARFAFNLSIKIHSSMKIHFYISDILYFIGFSSNNPVYYILSLNIIDHSTVQFVEQNMLYLHDKFS